MAVNDNPNDGLERDPRLAQLLAAASREEPPAALDAAILAAARREVGAQLKVAAAPGGGGTTSTPAVRAMHVKRNWYVPVSIAAVLVLSVSLVTLVHQEKGDELAQPPVATALPKAPAPVTEPPVAKPDSALSDAASARPKLAEDKRAEAAAVAKAPAAAEAYAEPAAKQRVEKREAPAESAAAFSGTARKDQAASAVTREQGPVGATTDAQQGAPGTAMGGLSAGTRSPAAAAPARERRADPFPAAVGERESPAAAAPPAPASAPAQAGRDALESRPRSEADRNLTRGAVQEAPAASAAPAPAARPAPALRQMAKRAVLWRGLEDQPPEKWLERLAEFKRDNRQADADELLAEFRRRFPDHPASAR